MATLNSEIILVKNIKLDKDYVNVLSYSESEMLELCRKNAVAIQNDYSFIRQNNNSIYSNFSYEQCLQANYIAFQNKDYSNKWFFAFIDEVVYTGEQNTEIKYTIDSWSTWFDYWQKQPCFINRQHVNNDTIGLHTIPENLDVGEVQAQGFYNLYGIANNFYYVISTTYNPFTEKDFTGVTQVNGNMFGTYLFAFDNDSTSFIEVFLKATNKAGKTQSIVSIFIAPSDLVDAIGTTLVEGRLQGDLGYEIYKSKQITPSSETRIKYIEDLVSLDKIHSFTDYTPKNNKLYCYPYNYLLVTNNNGSYNVYKYENFYDDKCPFSIQESLSVGCSIRAVPINYKNQEKNFDESITLSKYPTCAFATDSYTNWLTQNAVNEPTKFVGGIIGGVMSGNALTATTSIASTIASTIGDFYSASLLPNIEKGSADGDINFSAKTNTFNFYYMRAKKEYLKIIDNYFSRFGYKLNTIDTPNIIGRKNWNYVEIGSSENIGYGSVPSNYMNEINNACRQGITIWHNHENIGNYNLDNSIVS